MQLACLNKALMLEPIKMAEDIIKIKINVRVLRWFLIVSKILNMFGQSQVLILN
jgi:hypothetical protein